jgi:hypothetical protein
MELLHFPPSTKVSFTAFLTLVGSKDINLTGVLASDQHQPRR